MHKVHEKKRKFWVKRNGIWGTVHLNRDGKKEVDFYPFSETMTKLEPFEPAEDETAEDVIRRVKESVYIYILPDRRVSCEPKYFKVNPEKVRYSATLDDDTLHVTITHAEVNAEGIKLVTERRCSIKFSSSMRRKEEARYGIRKKGRAAQLTLPNGKFMYVEIGSPQLARAIETGLHYEFVNYSGACEGGNINDRAHEKLPIKINNVSVADFLDKIATREECPF